MRIEDIISPTVRFWAQEYVKMRTAECRAEKASLEPLSDIWKTWREGDWAAFRELVDAPTGAGQLRKLARDHGYSDGDLNEIIGRRVRDLPKTQANGQLYEGPYSFGLEVAVLRELTGTKPRPRSRVEEVLLS